MADPTPRLAPFDSDRLTVEARAVHDRIAAGPRGRVQGPLQVWLQSPGLAERAQELGAFCRYGTSLTPDLSEMAILVVGAHWRSAFEFSTHAPIAREAGLSAKTIDCLRQGLAPTDMTAAQSAVFWFSISLLKQKAVADADYFRAKAALGEQGLVELVGILGYYTLICMTTNVYDIPVEAGVESPFNIFSSKG